MKKPYECKKCEGSGMIQSENGDRAMKCPRCEGKGTYNPYTD